MTKGDVYIRDRFPCPCGGGEVEAGTIDYDKMYAGADPWVNCTCSDCNSKYAFSTRLSRSEVRVTDRASHRTIGTIGPDGFQIS
jgi:hypothetical protein